MLTEQALAALWGDVPTQRCSVHKHRNLIAHTLQRLHEEVPADTIGLWPSRVPVVNKF